MGVREMGKTYTDLHKLISRRLVNLIDSQSKIWYVLGKYRLDILLCMVSMGIVLLSMESCSLLSCRRECGEQVANYTLAFSLCQKLISFWEEFKKTLKYVFDLKDLLKPENILWIN